jgi:acetylornithine deacetylase/succinyl-diaminopimelate desuccinylase-like protein
MAVIDWKAATAEAARYLSDLVRFDTTNPPGNEIECARYLADLLAREGIEPLVLESAPGRGNVIGRLRGDGSKKPLLLMSHLDVIYADAARWKVPPFSGEIRDGVIWGRGTLDTKGLGVMHLMAMFLLKRAGARLKRDIIFMANADEETGGKWGAEWVAENHLDKIEAEFALNEGGFGMLFKDRVMFLCSNAEKGLTWAKLTAKGTPGHGSLPHSDNAVLHMTRAIDNITRYQQPIVITETFNRFARSLSKVDSRGHLLKLLKVSGIGRFLLPLIKDDRVRVMVQSTITPTVIKGGVKVNVIPDHCELMLDCRILPGVTRESLEQVICSLIGHDRIKLEFVVFNEATESPVETELFSIIRQAVAQARPDSVVSPFMMPGGTDSRFLRRKGIPAYGFNPVILDREELATVHADNEKLSLDNLTLGMQVMREIVEKCCV